MQLDFAKIRDYPITDIASMLGLKLEEKGDQLVGICPISKANNATAFKITPNKNRFICFCSTCKKLDKPGGDCIELVRRVRGVDVRQAAHEIELYFTKYRDGAGKAAGNDRPQQEVADARKQAGFDPLTYLQTLDTEHDALKGLDILPETLVAFQAGYSSKGLNRGRLAVAWHDMTGTIKSFIGVSLNGDLPLYLMPKGVLTPYWFGCSRVEAEGELRIVPTLLDVLRAFENGCGNCIAPLRPIEPDAITSLYSLMKDKSLILEL